MNASTVFIYETAIGAITFKQDSPFWITDIDGVSSEEIEIFSSRSNGQVGATVTGQSIKPRSITVDGSIFDPIRQNRRRLIDVIAPQIPATLTYQEGGESWYLNVVPEKTPEITPGDGVQNFQLRLYCDYPHWRTSKSYALQIAGLIPLFGFPLDTRKPLWLSKFSDSYFSTIPNTGNTPIEFTAVFAVRGALSNPELYHVDAKKGIYIKKDMVAGEKMIVSTVYGQKGVVFVDNHGTASNGFKYLDTKSDLSMALLPGENLMRIDAQTNRESLSVRIDAPEGVRSGV